MSRPEIESVLDAMPAESQWSMAADIEADRFVRDRIPDADDALRGIAHAAFACGWMEGHADAIEHGEDPREAAFHHGSLTVSERNPEIAKRRLE